MRRDAGRLQDREFDLVVVGAGIHGATAAWAAASQGWSTALIEKGDFGHATSANSLKIIHGGLRYLQKADIRRMRESILARRMLLQLAPQMVRPLPCVTATYGTGLRGRLAMGTALLVNDLVGWDRNRGVSSSSRLPRGRVISRREMLSIAPGCEPGNLSGGALWYDLMAEDTERLTLSFVLAAVGHGACAANYVGAESLLVEKNAVTGVAGRDGLTDEQFEIRAKVTIDATGPWTSDLLSSLPRTGPLPGPTRWAKAMNIFVARSLVEGHALGVQGAGQVFFLVPWRGGTMIGTWYRPHHGHGESAPRKEEIAEMVEEVDRLLPAAGISFRDVRFSHAGLVPLRPGSDHGDLSRQIEGEARVVDFSRAAGVDGLLGIYGVKYTTACRLAERAVALTANKLERTAVPVPPKPLVAPSADAPPGDVLDEESLSRLRARYGAALGHILDSIREDPSLAARVSRTRGTTAAEVVHAVREEMAVTLADVAFRRTGLGSSGHPGKAALMRCAALMAKERGWSADRTNAEVRAVEEKFAPYETDKEHQSEESSRP